MKRKTAVSIDDFDAYVEDWLDLRAHMNHQPSSIASTRKDIALFSRFCHERHIRMIKGKTLVRFVRWLHQERHNCSGTINRKRSSLCMYIRHLRLREIDGAEGLPVQYLPRARDAYRGPVKVLQPDEVRSLLSSIDVSSVLGRRDFTLFSLQYSLGLRLGEVLAINRDDLDLTANLLTIHGKGRRERILPLIDPVAAMLRRWLRYRNALLNSNTNPAIFLSKKGNRLSLRAAEENFQKILGKLDQLKGRRIVPHTLRHSFASHALEKGDGNLVVLKAVLGHARMKSTEIYLHPSLDMQRKAINDHLASDILNELREHRRGVFRIQPQRASGTGGG